MAFISLSIIHKFYLTPTNYLSNRMKGAICLPVIHFVSNYAASLVACIKYLWFYRLRNRLNKFYFSPNNTIAIRRHFDFPGLSARKRIDS